MSVSEMVQRRMINFGGQFYHVHDEILSIKLWKLPPGLTSNLYRILNAQQVTMIQEVSTYTGILDDIKGDPVMVHDEDIVRQANIFPLLFTISAQAAEQRTFYFLMTALIIPTFQKMFVRPRFSCIQNCLVGKFSWTSHARKYSNVKLTLHVYFSIRCDVPFHCDCAKCFKGTDTQAIVVPTNTHSI
jgi:hypothetical protein